MESADRAVLLLLLALVTVCFLLSTWYTYWAEMIVGSRSARSISQADSLVSLLSLLGLLVLRLLSLSGRSLSREWKRSP